MMILSLNEQLRLSIINRHCPPNLIIIIISQANQVQFWLYLLKWIQQTSITLYQSLLDDYILYHEAVLVFTLKIILNMISSTILKSHHPCENIWLHLTKCKSETILGLIYRYWSGDMAEFNEEKTMQDAHSRQPDKCSIIGDTNIHLIRSTRQQTNQRLRRYDDISLFTF